MGLSGASERMFGLEAEVVSLQAAMKELGQKTFGGQWLDHAVDCELGIMHVQPKCTCGLMEWLVRNQQYLGIKIPGNQRGEQ